MKTNLLLYAVLLCSCSIISNKEKEVIVIPNENIKLLLDSFVVLNHCDSCFFELFIDKKNPYDYDLIITKGLQRFTSDEDKYNNQKVFTVAYIMGVKFYIYSGVEHYFYLDTPQATDLKKHKFDDKSNRTIWIVSDSCGIFTIHKSDMAYPFVPSSYRNIIKFAPE